jgi:hypothetical protein
MIRMTILVLLCVMLQVGEVRAEAATLGILVEIHSPKLHRKVYPGFEEGELARAIAADLKVRFVGDRTKAIEPRPPLDQWNLVVVPDRERAPRNRLVFAINEKNEAFHLRLSFVSENGEIGPALTTEWRKPGDSTPYPPRATASQDLADLFVAEFIDEQFPAVIEHLSLMPLAKGQWQPSDGIQIALPLPAARHTQLRGSYFRIFGHWEEHEHASELGDVEIFADGAQNHVRSRWFNYEALAATWNENSGSVAYGRVKNCTRRLHFQTVYLAKYRIPSSARALSRQ